MPDGFQWAVGIGDADASAHVLKIEKALEGLEKDLHSVGAATKESADHLHSFGEKAIELNQVLEVGKKVYDVFKSIAEVVYDAGKEFIKTTFEAAEFGEQAEIAFKTLLGSAQASKDLMDDIVKTASRLPITTQSAVGYATNLITAGFKPDEMKTLLTSISDIGALNPGKQDQARDTLTAALRRMKSTGIDERVLHELGGIGVSTPNYMKALSERTGVGDMGELKKMISEKKISSDDAIYALMKTIANTEGGHLGNLSNELADTVGGLFSTLKSRFFEMAKDLAEGPGFKALKGFMANVVALTDSASESGKRMKAVLGDTFNAIMTQIFGSFAGEGGKSTLEVIFGKILDFAETIPGMITSAGTVVKAFFDGLFGNISDLDTDWSKIFSPESIAGLAPTFKEIGESIRAIAEAVGMVAGFLAPLINFFSGPGGTTAAAAGMGAVMGAGFGPLGMAAGAAIGGTIGAVSEIVDKTNDTGGAGDYGSADGPQFADGGIVTGRIDDATIGEGGETEVVAPLSQLQNFMDQASTGGGGGRGGMNAVINFAVNVSVGSSEADVDDPTHADLAQEILQKVREEMPSTLASMFEQMALEGAG